MSSILIREATLQDAEAIAHLHILVWQETYSSIVPQSYLDTLNVDTRIESWKARLDEPKHHVLVAILDGQICGFARGGPVIEAVHDSTFDGELYVINIVNAAKGKGIGRLLVQHVAEILCFMGLKKAVVWVLADNPSRRFYERLGAKDLGQEKFMHLGGTDLLEVAYGWHDLRSLCSPVVRD